MSSDSDEQIAKKPLRILTIGKCRNCSKIINADAFTDNGGLQAILILRVLKEVCKTLSKKDGYSTPLQPWELFDIIGGIGTGGWLAILLGRYRLRIDQCMSIYVTIANAIDPTKQRRDGSPIPGSPVAISQKMLIDKIDSIIAEHGIGKHLIDDEVNPPADPISRQCHAFAVGVVKRADEDSKQEYRLFRTYHPSSEAEHQGPDPARCNVSLACAATAAAKDFLSEYRLGIDGVTYWDDSFPRTHNVSNLALDEADSIFGKASDLDFILNISPGVVSPADVDKLKRTASMHSSKAPTRRKWSPKRFFSFSKVTDDPQLQMWTEADPRTNGRRKYPERSDTSSSTSSDASERELGHQKAIRERLRHDPRTADRHDIYFRLELTARGDKPYLDDVAMPDHAMQLAHEYLQREDAKTTLRQIANDGEISISGKGLTTTPGSSYADLNILPSIKSH